MKANVISIDLAKNVFQLCALNQANKVIVNFKVARNELLNELRQYEPTTVAMEACYSSHPWGRAIQDLGHTVLLIPPIKVKPFVQGNKNDSNDALAIGEASQRPNIHFVPVKSLKNQDIQSLQRIRERLIKQRTAVINQVRGLLAEYHIICAKGATVLYKQLPRIIEDAEQPLTMTARTFFQEMYSELTPLNSRIVETTNQSHTILQDDEDYKRVQQVPGIGPIIAAETIAAVDTGKQFNNGRQFAAWLGLTPRHYASGESCHMGKISKRGNKRLRTLLIHGARTVMNWVDKKNDKLSCWIKSLLTHKSPKIVIVALANKLARILWSVLSERKNYQSNY
jgi:transposase